jgi:hypothetical protein
MSTLDDIAQERQRIAERLARVDAERAKLAEELAELETAERVLSRFGQPRSKPGQRGRRARTGEDITPAKARDGRKRRAREAPRRRTQVQHLAMRPRAPFRPIHRVHRRKRCAPILPENSACRCGRTISAWRWQRHRRAGRLEQRDGRWWDRAAAG